MKRIQPYYTCNQAVEYLGLSRAVVRRAIASGRLKAINTKEGGPRAQYIILLDDLVEFAARTRIGGYRGHAAQKASPTDDE